VRVLRIGLAAIVVGVWSVGYYRAYAYGEPEPTGLNLLMVPVLTWALGGEYLDRARRKKNGDNGS
jgi:hypothetical protein